MSEEPLKNRNVIIEFIPIGAYMRVSAMDTASLTEITISGPVNTPETTLRRNAIKRLEYVLKKKGIIA